MEDDEYHEGILEDPCNPNDYQSIENADSKCIKYLIEIINIETCKSKIVENAFESRGEIGLFELFCNPSLEDSVLEWTNNDFARPTHFRTTKYQMFHVCTFCACDSGQLYYHYLLPPCNLD